jgi:hypothetical protein
MNFTIDTNEAAFIVRVLGQLPTESGAVPLHQKLVQQFQAAQAPAQAEEAVVAD